MARLTVSQIMAKIATTVNQSADAPTTGSDEFNLWLAFINRALEEWSISHDWESLRKTYFAGVTGISQATVPLPQDYRKLAAAPRLHTSDETTIVEFPEVLPEQRGLYASTDKYITSLGDPSGGYNLIFHPATLASGASLEIPYYSMPTSLASPAQVPTIEDPQFLIDRTIGYIFESRSDARFQLSEVKARERLMTMIENADTAKFNSYSNPSLLMTPEKKQGFRIGRD
jgi:hypothetical protein